MTNITNSIRGVYDAFATGDMPTVLAVLDPEVDWTEAEGFPYGGRYTGPDAVLQNVFMNLGSEWTEFEAVAREFITEGNTVVALGEYTGTYNATGKSFKAPFAHVWKFEGDKVVAFQQYTDTVLVRKAME